MGDATRGSEESGHEVSRVQRERFKTGIRARKIGEPQELCNIIPREAHGAARHAIPNHGQRIAPIMRRKVGTRRGSPLPPPA